jgi:predicted RNase H-like HicB family nuclease
MSVQMQKRNIQDPQGVVSIRKTVEKASRNAENISEASIVQ